MFFLQFNRCICAIRNKNIANFTPNIELKKIQQYFYQKSSHCTFASRKNGSTPKEIVGYETKQKIRKT